MSSRWHSWTGATKPNIFGYGSHTCWINNATIIICSEEEKCSKFIMRLCGLLLSGMTSEFRAFYNNLFSWWINVRCILDCFPVSVSTEALYCCDDQLAHSYSNPNKLYISGSTTIFNLICCKHSAHLSLGIFVSSNGCASADVVLYWPTHECRVQTAMFIVHCSVYFHSHIFQWHKLNRLFHQGAFFCKLTIDINAYWR